MAAAPSTDRPAPPGGDWRRPAGLVRGAVLLLLRAYQLSLSSVLGRQCRFLPSCSDYAAEAIARHGLGRGSVLGVARMCRCHPWGGQGYDPVPLVLPARRGAAAPAQDRARSCAENP